MPISNITKKIKRIAEKTAGNNHTKAYIMAAQLLNHDKLLIIFQYIEAIEQIEGYVPQSLSEYRYKKYEELMKYAKDNLTADEFKLLYHSV